MKKRIAISQSVYFPWVGLLEQIRLADVFVHYDDVQFSKGSFTNRVQVKQPGGSIAWMTVPLRDFKLGQRIDEVSIQDANSWVPKHRAILERSFAEAPYKQEAIDLAEQVWSRSHNTIAQLSRSSLIALAYYFGLSRTTCFIDSTSLRIQGSGSQRVLDIVKALGGNVYITGHGARNYLDHDLFERSDIDVQYMQYLCIPYEQLHGAFTPYVTALDLVANCGRGGARVIQSGTIGWREFIGASPPDS